MSSSDHPKTTFLTPVFCLYNIGMKSSAGTLSRGLPICAKNVHLRHRNTKLSELVELIPTQCYFYPRGLPTCVHLTCVNVCSSQRSFL